MSCVRAVYPLVELNGVATSAGNLTIAAAYQTAHIKLKKIRSKAGMAHEETSYFIGHVHAARRIFAAATTARLRRTVLSGRAAAGAQQEDNARAVEPGALLGPAR